MSEPTIEEALMAKVEDAKKSNMESTNGEDLFLRHFTFQLNQNHDDAIKKITISENSEYLPGHGSIIWAGSVLFSFHLFDDIALRVGFENKRVLDLGSGCGMTAMAAALSFPTSTIIASDLPANVRHLQRMIELNNLQSQCDAMALDWNAPEQLTAASPTNSNNSMEAPTTCQEQQDKQSDETSCHPPKTFDTIIACEVVYHEPILIPLLNTIDYHLKSNGLVYFISARHRHCYLQLFYELQERGYEIVGLKTLSVPFIPAQGCFVDPDKIQKDLDKMKENPLVYKGESLGTITLTPSEELSVGWFSEGEFLYDLDKLVMVTVRRRKQ
jgi:predicted nicotinamide N-methyase